jgi:hypothetical protein
VTSFIVALIAALLALGGVIWSGITHRRNLHYGLVVAMLVALTLSIWRARVWGHGLVFEGAAGTWQTVHRVAVVLTFALLPLVGWTGLRLARARGTAAADARPAHRRRAIQFVTALVAAALLGTVMTILARRV